MLEEATFWIDYARLLERKVSALFQDVSLLCHECGRRCKHFDHYVVHMVLRHVRQIAEEA